MDVLVPLGALFCVAKALALGCWMALAILPRRLLDVRAVQADVVGALSVGTRPPVRVLLPRRWPRRGAAPVPLTGSSAGRLDPLPHLRPLRRPLDCAPCRCDGRVARTSPGAWGRIGKQRALERSRSMRRCCCSRCCGRRCWPDCSTLACLQARRCGTSAVPGRRLAEPLEHRQMFGTSWPGLAGHPGLLRDALHAFGVLGGVLGRLYGEGPRARTLVDRHALFIGSTMHSPRRRRSRRNTPPGAVRAGRPG